MHVVPLDADTPTPLIESWHRLHNAIERELEPQVPPAPLDEAFAAALSDDFLARTGWLAVEDGGVIGYALLELPLLDNPHLAMLDVGIDPDRRRQGIATELTRLAARAAQDAGRRTMLIEALDGTPGAAACAALGSHSALGSTSSTLWLADLDRGLVDRWIDQRAQRAAGYSLVRWIGPCPDDLLKPFAQLREAMQTAPKGDLDINIEWSPESIRAAEAAHVRCHRRNLVLCARDDESGELVALTDVLVPDGRRTLAMQEDTVVRPDHRNRGLGRWVKAEMLRWLAEEEPQLEQIVTWNATENAAMRGINTELGFVAGDTWTECQFAIDALVKRLD
jgi:GNAT superfamily N-acetyltransferase